MAENKLIIDPQEVEKTFLDCLYEEDEGDTNLNDVLFIEGVLNKFRFHPGRLEEKRNKVTEWLKALPRIFRKNSGGGWSFSNACNQENGVQWTGLHQRMEQLLCMGMGLGLVECPMPREMWSALPGGMPYYTINLE